MAMAYYSRTGYVREQPNKGEKTDNRRCSGSAQAPLIDEVSVVSA